MDKQYEIKEHLSEEELNRQSLELSDRYAMSHYRHKNGQLYAVISVTTINIDGKSYWGFIYRQCDDQGKIDWRTTYHTRPLYEFLDGRYEEVA